jgi:hypothetical protein
MMRLFIFSKRLSMILSASDLRVSAEFLMAVDEIVFAEYYIFHKLLEESGKIYTYYNLNVT